MKQLAAGMKASRIRGRRPMTVNDSQPKIHPKPMISSGALINIGLTCVNQFFCFQSGFFLVRFVVFEGREDMHVIFAEMIELSYHIKHFDRLLNARRDSIQVLFGRRRSVLVGRAQQGTVLVNRKKT